MPASSFSPIDPVLAQLAGAADAGQVSGATLMGVVAAVPDPRDPRGIRHQIATILALAACAVLSGCRSFTAVGEWVANAPEQVLSTFGGAGCRPSESAIRRALQRPDGDELDSAVGRW